MQQVADSLQVSVQTVRREIARGNLQATRPGGQIRISEKAMQSYGKRPLSEMSRCRSKLKVGRAVKQQVIVPHIAPYKQKIG
jgi:DNA binding domain, excisionase family